MVFDHDPDDRTEDFNVLSKDTIVSHYKIISRLGAGGMGEVYLAEDTKLNRQVALKFLSNKLCQDSDSRIRFQSEARAIAGIEHPNIVTIYEVDEYQKRPFFAMQYLEGQSLSEVIKQKSLSADEILKIAIQICRGLSEAHNANTIHRDIKPSNIILDGSGKAILFDFGLAKQQGSDPLTNEGSTLGTIGYMSPEQLNGEKIDVRSDLFSFGVVLYEMITGKQPFYRENIGATLNAVLNDTPEPIEKYRTDIPENLITIVNKALEKDCSKRYQNSVELLDKLHRFKRAKRRKDDPKENWRRNVIIFFASVLIICIALVAFHNPSQELFLKLVGINKVPSKIHLVVLPFKNVGENQSNQPFCDGLMETLSSNLTQLRELWVVPTTETRRRNITSVEEAKKAFNVNFAVSGSVQHFSDSDKVRVTMNLSDAKKERYTSSLIVDGSLANVMAFQDSLYGKLVDMFDLQLQPERWQLLTTGATSNSQAYKYYIQARGYLIKFYDKEALNNAISLFTKAINEDNNYASAYAGLGEANWRLYVISNDTSFIKPAINNSNHAIELDNKLPIAHFSLGLIYRGTGRYEDAINEYQYVLANDSTNYDALLGLANSYYSLNKIERAEEIYKKIIVKYPEYWRSHYFLAYFYFLTGKYDNADSLLNQTIPLLPDEDETAFNDIGALYLYLGNLNDAKDKLERSIAIEPNYQAYNNLGISYLYESNFARASENFKNALDIDNSDYRTWMNLASAQYQIPEQKGNSEENYRKAILLGEIKLKVSSDDNETLSNLADCYQSLEVYDSAKILINQALLIAPSDLNNQARAGIIYNELGETDSAMIWIARAIKSGYPRSYLENIPELKELFESPEMDKLLNDDR